MATRYLVDLMVNSNVDIGREQRDTLRQAKQRK